MFFCIELIKINIAKEALQSICEEATYFTIAHDWNSYSAWASKVDTIIEKYRPSFIPKKARGYTSTLLPVIRYRIQIYTNISEMLSAAPYGGDSVIHQPYSEYGVGEGQEHFYWPNPGTEFIPVNNMEYTGLRHQWYKARDWHDGSLVPNNYAFVITFTCNYPFSSGMVKMLFGGGINTKLTVNNSGYSGAATGVKGTMYILWARGSGIINKK